MEKQSVLLLKALKKFPREAVVLTVKGLKPTRAQLLSAMEIVFSRCNVYDVRYLFLAYTVTFAGISTK